MHNHEVCLHLLVKMLSGETFKRWTMRHNGTLGRWHRQVCYRFLMFKIFSFLDNLKSKLRHAELLKCACD